MVSNPFQVVKNHLQKVSNHFQVVKHHFYPFKHHFQSVNEHFQVVHNLITAFKETSLVVMEPLFGGAGTTFKWCWTAKKWSFWLLYFFKHILITQNHF